MEVSDPARVRRVPFKRRWSVKGSAALCSKSAAGKSTRYNRCETCLSILVERDWVKMKMELIGLFQSPCKKTPKEYLSYSVVSYLNSFIDWI